MGVHDIRGILVFEVPFYRKPPYRNQAPGGSSGTAAILHNLRPGWFQLD